MIKSESPVVEFLKSQNADFHIVDKDGNGVIHLLAENKRIENKESLTKAVEVISRVISPEMFNSRVSTSDLCLKLHL